ncbi:MAG: DNA/RNA non-specific endonuclease [Chloracidobacterium sp.]|nr:DNA/RNA non-specific endonuclease [Chloracidobacterium sp.]MCO5332416.1 DNA/RNA non-specific endonuclease [Pyrinomonadaceae bacterium]
MKTTVCRALLIAMLAVVSALVQGCSQIGQNVPEPPPKHSTHELPHDNVQRPDPLPFGDPSNAAADPADLNNLLVRHRSHVLSYNNSRGTLNWAAWFTTKADLGERLERPMFKPDTSLPNGAKRIQYYDYSGSGYDRGHIVPSADRFADPELNAETFLMTNIVPQTSSLNQYPWNKLEVYARSLARSGNTLYTIAGVYGEQERLKNRVTVPTNCWKVIAVFRGGAIQFDTRTRVIAVDMPNIAGLEDADWKQYITTVDEIEKRTGLDLFSNVPKELQERLESRPYAALKSR